MNIVSVVIPTFNDSQYLEQAIKSCLNQDSYCDIIVIDDNSNEDHKKVIAKLTSRYETTLLVNKINYGLAGSRNKAIERCKCPYIIALDCDDTLYGNVLGSMYAELEAGNDIVYGDITDGNKEKKVYAKPEINITKESFLKQNPLFCTSMFKKDIWQKAGGYPMFPYSIYEDYAFWCKCQSVGAKFKYIDKLIYHHTNRGDSMLSELHSKTNEYKELSRKGLDYSINKNCFRTI